MAERARGPVRRQGNPNKGAGRDFAQRLGIVGLAVGDNGHEVMRKVRWNCDHNGIDCLGGTVLTY